MSESKEKETIRKLIKGDVLSFEDVYNKYNRKIYTFSFRYLKNKEEAEGIVQEVFLKLWKSAKHLKPDSDLNAWLFTVTFNDIRKRFRKLASEKKHIENFLTLIEFQPDEITETEYYDLVDKVDLLLENLPTRQKTILLLRKDEDLSNSEIAERLNLSKKTVENHLNRARKTLKRAMLEQGLLSFLFFWLFIS